jgi:hypothetical protein
LGIVKTVWRWGTSSITSLWMCLSKLYSAFSVTLFTSLRDRENGAISANYRARSLREGAWEGAWEKERGWVVRLVIEPAAMRTLSPHTHFPLQTQNSERGS